MMAYSQQQIKQYLTRIGLEGPLPLCAETLSKIIHAHYCTVPYENLDILAGRPLNLDPEALYEKIVFRKQGGFCFELNEAMGMLLSSMGFSVSHYAARFILGEPEGITPMRRHHILVVRLPEGDFLCDAGVMREAPRIALCLNSDQIQSDGVGEYYFETDPFYGSVLLQRLPGKDFKRVFGFTLEPQANTDFVMPTFYCEKHPDSPFNKHRMVGIYTADGGAWNLVGSSLRRLEAGNIVETRELPDEEIPEVLKELFGIPKASAI